MRSLTIPRRVRTSGRVIMATTPDAYVVVFAPTGDRRDPWRAITAVSTHGRGVTATYR